MSLRKLLKKFNHWEEIAKALLLAGGIIFIITPLAFWVGQGYELWTPINSEKVGQLGDFIGGLVGSLWALSGVLLFYSALKLQQKEFANQLEVNTETKVLIEKQTTTLSKQQIENTIFQLLNLLHRSMENFNHPHNGGVRSGDAAFKKMQEDLSKAFCKGHFKRVNGHLQPAGQRYLQVKPESIAESEEWFWEALDEHFRINDSRFRRIALQFYHLIIFVGDTLSFNPEEKKAYIELIKASISHVAFRQFLYYSGFRKPEPQKAIAILNVHGIINYENMEGIENLEYHREILKKHLRQIKVPIGEHQ